MIWRQWHKNLSDRFKLGLNKLTELQGPSEPASFPEDEPDVPPCLDTMPSPNSSQSQEFAWTSDIK